MYKLKDFSETGVWWLKKLIKTCKFKFRGEYFVFQEKAKKIMGEITIKPNLISTFLIKLHLTKILLMLLKKLLEIIFIFGLQHYFQNHLVPAGC